MYLVVRGGSGGEDETPAPVATPPPASTDEPVPPPDEPPSSGGGINITLTTIDYIGLGVIGLGVIFSAAFYYRLVAKPVANLAPYFKDPLFEPITNYNSWTQSLQRIDTEAHNRRKWKNLVAEDHKEARGDMYMITYKAHDPTNAYLDAARSIAKNKDLSEENMAIKRRIKIDNAAEARKMSRARVRALLSFYLYYEPEVKKPSNSVSRRQLVDYLKANASSIETNNPRLANAIKKLSESMKSRTPLPRSTRSELVDLLFEMQQLLLIPGVSDFDGIPKAPPGPTEKEEKQLADGERKYEKIAAKRAKRADKEAKKAAKKAARAAKKANGVK